LNRPPKNHPSAFRREAEKSLQTTVCAVKEDGWLKLNKSPYAWTRKDKGAYASSMVPFLLSFAGAVYVLATRSMYLSLLYVGIFILTNVFQAGCCIGCPYRGKYCPAFSGVYLGNLLSALFYANRPYDEKFFTRNAAAGETSLLIFLLFPLYWFFQAAWYYAPAYLILFTLHVILFAPTQCEKCGYNTVCPGGKAWRSCRSVIKSG
jgi:hypothetical protein